MNIRKWLDLYSTSCKLKYNSDATVKNYTSCIGNFLQQFSDYREPKEIPTDKIKEWLLGFDTINTRSHNLSAVKSFYTLTVGMPKKIDSIPFPKPNKKLPIVLSQQEVQKMFNVCTNLKHKTILSLLYSTGIRVSELINLKWQHIDRSRMIINIVQGKGKKDRQVMLTPELIPLLEAYYRQYRTKTYILSGQFSEQYSARSVGEVVKQLAEKAGLDSKRVYTHLIRHCTFTHMVEAGTDINLVQRIAGHSSVKTTNIYLHLSHNLISSITSPLAKINLAVSK